MTGRTIGAEECLRIGAANRVAPARSSMLRPSRWWTSCWRPRRSPSGCAKRVLDGVAKPTLAASLEQEVTIQQTLVATDDFREAGAAFMEKRPPRCSGNAARPARAGEAPEPEPEKA